MTGPDSDGNTWDLTVSYDETVVSDATDAQINVTASGTLTDTSGTEYELTLHQTYVRIGKNVITSASPTSPTSATSRRSTPATPRSPSTGWST